MPARSILALLALAAPLAAQETAPAPAATAQPAKEKKICESAVSTGSIMPKRVCHTKAEWDAIHAAGQRHAGQMLDHPNSAVTRN